MQVQRVPVEWLSIVMLGVLSTTSGCLYENPDGIEASSEAAEFSDGTLVVLTRHSTLCGGEEPTGAFSAVGSGVEYSSDTMKAIGAPCEDAPAPGVDVYVERNSVILDFSNVEAPGAFPFAEFDGYILEIMPTEGAPMVLFASPNPARSTFDFEPARIGYDEARIELDFAGLAYDAGSFLEVELILAPE